MVGNSETSEKSFHLLESASLEGVPGRPGNSQKEGQEDQREVKGLGRFPLGPGPLGLPSGSSLASLQTSSRKALPRGTWGA